MDGRHPCSVFLSSFELLDFPFEMDGRRPFSVFLLSFELLPPPPLRSGLEVDLDTWWEVSALDPLEINDFLEDALVVNILLEGELINSSSSAADASTANPLPTLFRFPNMLLSSRRTFFDTLVRARPTFLKLEFMLSIWISPLPVSSVKPSLQLRRTSTSAAFSTKASTSATQSESLISHLEMDKWVSEEFPSSDSKRDCQSSSLIRFRKSSLRTVSDGSLFLSLLISFFMGVLSVAMSRGSLGTSWFDSMSMTDVSTLSPAMNGWLRSPEEGLGRSSFSTALREASGPSIDLTTKLVVPTFTATLFQRMLAFW